MKKIRTTFKLLCVAVASTCALSAINAQNLVQDPGFEDSADSTFGNPFSPAWTVVDPSANSTVGGNPAFAHSGNNYAALGTQLTPPGPPNVATLSQTVPLATVAGTLYTLSFWLANDVGIPTNFFEAYFNGALVFSTTSPLPFPNDGAYHQITLAGLLATTNSTGLEFRYQHDADFWRLDDVAVTRAPEGGATLWLLAPTFAGLCLLYSRSARRRSSSLS